MIWWMGTGQEMLWCFDMLLANGADVGVVAIDAVFCWCSGSHSCIILMMKVCWDKLSRDKARPWHSQSMRSQVAEFHLNF